MLEILRRNAQASQSSKKRKHRAWGTPDACRLRIYIKNEIPHDFGSKILFNKLKGANPWGTLGDGRRSFFKNKRAPQREGAGGSGILIMDQASAEDFSHYFLGQFFFVEKFGSTGHRDPKQKPSEPHQARLPSCVFFSGGCPRTRSS